MNPELSSESLSFSQVSQIKEVIDDTFVSPMIMKEESKEISNSFASQETQTDDDNISKSFFGSTVPKNLISTFNKYSFI